MEAKLLLNFNNLDNIDTTLYLQGPSLLHVHYASKEGHFNLVQSLIQRHDINIPLDVVEINGGHATIVIQRHNSNVSAPCKENDGLGLIKCGHTIVIGGFIEVFAHKECKIGTVSSAQTLMENCMFVDEFIPRSNRESKSAGIKELTSHRGEFIEDGFQRGVPNSLQVLDISTKLQISNNSLVLDQYEVTMTIIEGLNHDKPLHILAISKDCPSLLLEIDTNHRLHSISVDQIKCRGKDCKEGKFVVIDLSSILQKFIDEILDCQKIHGGSPFLKRLLRKHVLPVFAGPLESVENTFYCSSIKVEEVKLTGSNSKLGPPESGKSTSSFKDASEVKLACDTLVDPAGTGKSTFHPSSFKDSFYKEETSANSSSKIYLKHMNISSYEILLDLQKGRCILRKHTSYKFFNIPRLEINRSSYNIWSSSLSENFTFHTQKVLTTVNGRYSPASYYNHILFRVPVDQKNQERPDKNEFCLQPKADLDHVMHLGLFQYSIFNETNYIQMIMTTLSKSIKVLEQFYQGFITLVVAHNLARLALILSMLVLQAGDVERNPGPATLDDFPLLDELAVIPKLETKWMALGLQLSVSEQQLSNIKSKYNNLSKCKYQMFQLALKNKITWRLILQALYRIGEEATAEKVCQIYEIPTECLLQIVNSESTKLVPDEAVSSKVPNKLQAEVQPSSVEYQTFHSFLESLELITQSDPIMLANALFSSGIICQDSLHKLRTLHSDERKAAYLISLLKDILYHQPFKFDGFVKALHSIHIHEALADRLSQTYRFNFIMHKMKKYSQDNLDLNYFNTELNNSKLISDSVHMKASRAGNLIEMCTILLGALEPIGLGESFLNHLDSFQNTKSVSFQLKDAGDVAKNHSSSSLTAKFGNSSSQSDKKARRTGSDTHSNLEGDSDPFLSAVSDNLSPESNSFREFLSSETVLPPEEPHMGKLLPHTFNSGSELTTGSCALDLKALMSTTSGRKSTGLLKGNQLVDMLRGPKRKPQQDKFVEAVKKQDSSQVDSILSSERGVVNVDYLFENDQTALMLAAIEGDENMVQVLLNHKASVTCVDVDGCSPLFHAADKGNYEVVKMLVGHPQTDINLKNKVGVPILLNPAMKGFSMITEYLLEHGAKVDLKSEGDGMTALYGACKRGQRDVVRLLLDYHADVTNVCGKTKRTPLEEATEGEDAEIVKLLMKAVSKANEKSRQLFEVYTPEAVRELIIDGAKVDSRNGCNATPLIVHAQSGHIEVVKMLIRLKANVDLQDNAGFSALIVTARQGNVEIVQILIAAGAILDLKENENGYTALMFGIVGGHVNVVKELMLAKSSIFLRNKDGKCAIDLAKECGNAEMRDMIKLHTSTPLGKDPFIHLLSGYMAGKTPSASPKVIQKSIKDVNVNGGAKKAGANVMALVPKSPAIPDESSSVSVELTKCYKRIADLETRVHDLTIMGTMEISDETDLSYMERGRLEAEFKKLKEAKKKAEQYAIEAKQTAQRLSAENLKYREDLSKERHFNELSRKNIMKEVEQEFGKGTRPSEMVMKAQDDIFRQEVREKARELVKNDPKKGQIYERVTMNHDEIRKIIMEQSIRANLLHVAIVGLPYSGKSSLLDAIMKRKSGRIGYSDKFEVCEAVVHISQLDETSDWSLATKFQAEGHALAVVLTQFLARQHKLPSFKNESEVEAVFDDSEIQQYFLLSYSQLKQTISKFEDTDSLDRLVTDSLSFINFYNIGVGKAVYELLIILGGSCRNLLIINVLNLFRDHPDVLRKPVNLGDPKFYEGKYSGEDLELLKLNSALHYYMRAIESGVAHYREGCNTILVGTHADEFESDTKLKERVKQIETMIMGYAEEIGVESVINPDMIAVSNVKESNDYEKMRNILIRLIEERKQFEIDLPMRFLFLRCMLHSTKRLFISQNKLNEYAVKCSINLENEVRRFIQIFHDCGSLLHLKTPQRAFIILRPVEFVQNLNKLYYIHSDQSFPKAVIEATECGIISEKLARSLWQGCGYESISLCDFYISILLSIGLMVKLKKSDTDPVYYMPSLCSKCDTAEPDVFSDSLIIDYSISAIPFHMLCGFVNHFQNHDHITLTKSPYCNVVNFAWKSDDGAANITIRFCRQFLEISITDINEGSHSFLASIYSTVKTGCIEVLNKIRSDLVQFRCKYSIICPKSKDKPHFVQFNISDTSEGNLKCIKCDCSEIELSKFPARLLWVQAAYQGNFQSTLHPDDLLTVARLKEISDMILHDSSSDMRELQEFKKFSKISISDQCQNYNTMDEVVFSILYEWRKKVPDATVPKLARILRDCGFYNISLKLDPSLIIMKLC